MRTVAAIAGVLVLAVWLSHVLGHTAIAFLAALVAFPVGTALSVLTVLAIYVQVRLACVRPCLPGRGRPRARRRGRRAT